MPLEYQLAYVVVVLCFLSVALLACVGRVVRQRDRLRDENAQLKQDWLEAKRLLEAAMTRIAEQSYLLSRKAERGAEW